MVSFGQLSLILGSLIILSGLFWNSYQDYEEKNKILTARETLAKGFPRVARFQSLGLREETKLTNDECNLLLAIDSALKDIEALKLNAEKCLYSGHTENPNPYLALSIALDSEKKDDLAQKVLLSAIEKVNHHKSFYFQLAKLNLKQSKKDNAQKILLGLVRKNNGNEAILLEVMQFFTKRNEWSTAYQFVSEMEKLKELNFESQLTLYGVSKKNSDKDRAEKYSAQVNQVLSKLPKEKALQIRAQLEKI